MDRVIKPDTEWIAARKLRIQVAKERRDKRIDRERRRKKTRPVTYPSTVPTGHPDRDYFRSWKESTERIDRRRAKARERQRLSRARKRTTPVRQRRRSVFVERRATYSADYAKAAAARLELPPGLHPMSDVPLDEDQVLAAWEFFRLGRVLEA